MPKSDKPPSPRVAISARDLKDIIRDELYGLQSLVNESARLGDEPLTNKVVKEIAKTIVTRALLSPR